MNKKKWLLRVVSLTALFCLSLGLGIFAACSPVTDNGDPNPTPDGDHTHSYTEWARSESEHWMTCPDDGAIDESTRAEHAFVGGKCACGMDEPDGHVHDWVWKHNDTEHWQFCETDEVEKDGSRAAHELTDGKCECGYEKVEGPVVELDTREFYVVGSGSGSLKNASWTQTSNDFKFTKASEADEAGNTVYTIELDLYSGDEFKIVQPNTIPDNSWDDTSFGFYELATATGKFKDGGGANITVETGADGTYQFTIRTTKNGPLKANKVEWKLIKSLPSLEVTAQYDMYIIGNLKASGNNQWSNDTSRMIKMTLQEDNKTFSVKVNLVTADRFKVYNAKTNQYYPTGTNNDLKVDTDGLYEVAWVIGAANPTITKGMHDVHNYSEWAYNADEHWKFCPDDGVIDESTRAEHKLTDNKCECGYVYNASNPGATAGLTYEYDEAKGGYLVTGHELKNAPGLTEIVIPATYEDKPVVGVKANAFCPATSSSTYDYNNVTKIVIPDSVKEIGRQAFSKLTGLKDLTLGNGLETIDFAAFMSSSVTAVTLPESLKSLGQQAFYQCNALKSVYIPLNGMTVGQKVFQYCSALTDVTFGKGGTLTFPSNCYMFANCTSLKEIVFPEGVTSLGGYILQNCTELETVVVPSTVTASVGTNAFSGCTNLKNVTLGGVTIIYAGAFNKCTSLETITIPASVEKIQATAFQSCTALKSVTVEGNTTGWFTGKTNDETGDAVDASIISDPAKLATYFLGDLAGLGSSTYLHRGFEAADDECKHENVTFNYTESDIPAPVAGGGQLVGTCADCSEEVTVSYNAGVAQFARSSDSAPTEITAGTTYGKLQNYVSASYAWIGFRVTAAGTYRLNITQVLNNHETKPYIALTNIMMQTDSYTMSTTNAVIKSGKNGTTEHALAYLDRVVHATLRDEDNNLVAADYIELNFKAEDVGLYVTIGMQTSGSVAYALFELVAPTAVASFVAPADVAVLPKKEY